MYLIYWSIFANYQPDKSKKEIILNIFKSGGGGYPKLSTADETKSFLATSSSITISDISHAFLMAFICRVSSSYWFSDVSGASETDHVFIFGHISFWEISQLTSRPGRNVRWAREG